MEHLNRLLSNDRQLSYGWFEALYTRVDVAVCADSCRKDIPMLLQTIENELSRIGRLYNFFDSDSELSYLNRYAFIGEVMLSEEFFAILERCLFYHELTEGLFDVTVHSLHKLRHGTDFVQLNQERRTARFQHQDVQIDLSGFIKGYALDWIIDYLCGEEITDAFINLGNSSIYGLGDHPCGKGWKVGRLSEGIDVPAVLCNQAFTTSGNAAYNRSHIIHPILGEYVRGVRELSVITSTGELGEVLSTALFVANRHEQVEILKKKATAGTTVLTSGTASDNWKESSAYI